MKKIILVSSERVKAIRGKKAKKEEQEILISGFSRVRFTVDS